jgi:vacuolar-type H+-ATPase subunit E/Vma4
MDFIHLEIEIESRKQFEQKKKVIVEAKIAEVVEQYRTLEEGKHTQYKIDNSEIVNLKRTEGLIATNKTLLKLLNKTQLMLNDKINKDKGFYKDLMGKLILQGLLKLLEPIVDIRCLPRDKALVESLLEKCASDFSKKLKDDIGEDRSVVLTVNTDRLTLRELPNCQSVDLNQLNDSEWSDRIKLPMVKKDITCFGGVLLTNEDGTIVLNNTLDSRCELTFNDSLPDIRARLM